MSTQSGGKGAGWAAGHCLSFRNGYFEFGLEYLKNLEECMDDGDSRVAKEMKLFDALEHKSIVIEVGNQKFAIFTKAPLRTFGEPLMRYSLPCKVDGQGARDTELDLVDLANYVTEKVLDSMRFVHVSISDYGRKMVNDVNVEIHGVKFKADFVVLDYANEGEPSIMFGRDFLATTKSQVDFGLGEYKMNLTMFEEVNSVVDLLEEIGSSSEEFVKMGKANRNKGEKMKEVLDIRYKELEESKHILEVLENYVIYKKKLDEILIVDTGASVSVFPYSLYKDLGLGDPRPYQAKLIMADNTQAKAMGEVKNVRIQVGYQDYVVDLLVLDISVDPELPLLLGRPFLRTCGAIIDMGRGTLCIDDGVIRHTYFPKPRSKSYVETFEMEGEDDWLKKFKAMEAYFNPFKNIIVFKKLVDFLGSLPVQLKNIDWGNEGYGTYKKIDGDGNWHARFEIVTPSGRKFNRAFKTKTTTRKLSGKFTTEDVLRKVARRHTYCERLSKLQDRSIGVPRVGNWGVFNAYGFEDNLRNMMKLKYIYEGDGDVFVDYSWERSLSIDDEVYPEWVLEFFLMMDFDKDVDKSNLMTEKCIWFRLCGNEHILTLPEFAVVLGLFMEDELVRRDVKNKIVDDERFGGCTLIMDDEIKKYSKPIDCKYWTTKMLAEELDEKNQCLLKETGIPTQAGIGSSEQRQEPRGLNSSCGD
ncbi:hypothetical protein Tco_1293003 [Tanacetum coccineum]